VAGPVILETVAAPLVAQAVAVAVETALAAVEPFFFITKI
jgi:hypothetical protein